eukprot:6457489-Amphidinium_carterae.1
MALHSRFRPKSQKRHTHTEQSRRNSNRDYSTSGFGGCSLKVTFEEERISLMTLSWGHHPTCVLSSGWLRKLT